MIIKHLFIMALFMEKVNLALVIDTLLSVEVLSVEVLSVEAISEAIDVTKD